MASQDSKELSLISRTNSLSIKGYITLKIVRQQWNRQWDLKLVRKKRAERTLATVYPGDIQQDKNSQLV